MLACVPVKTQNGHSRIQFRNINPTPDYAVSIFKINLLVLTIYQ
jgi:hypothetical protein